MNPQPEEDLQQRLRKLEIEVNSSKSNAPSHRSYVEQLTTWFNRQSATVKLAVLGVAAICGFAILQTVLKLVASVVSLAVLALLVYLGYKFFVSSSAQNKQ